jgi:uridine phosphorylase
MDNYLTERYLRLDDGSLPHMGVKGKGDVAPYVLLSGNPARVERTKDYLTDCERVSSERGYLVYTGRYKEVKVTVASSGMGSPSIAVALEELAVTGGTTFIRTGSCASIDIDADVGSLIIATGAVRDEGTSPYYAPTIYPAVADHHVVAALCQAAEDHENSYHLGLIRSTDSFYEGERKIGIIKQWQKCRVLAFEMESAALFTVAGVLGLRSGAICVPGSNLLNGKSTYQGHNIEQFNTGINHMIRIALEAIVLLSAQDSKDIKE